MAEMDARQRLQNALKKIDTRLRELEKRPSLEEIEELRAAREADLQEIKAMRAELEQLKKAES